jgi:hydrogenase maturation protease
MSNESGDGSGGPTVVAGLGSSFGDDQAGWRLADKLRLRRHLPARVKRIHDATQLVEELEGCSRLIVVDGCRSGGRLGEITRLRWPDPRVARQRSHSTHGISVCDALRLAEHLGRLPPAVEIIGIEVGECEAGVEMCREVLQAVGELEGVLYGELCEVTRVGRPAGRSP